MVMAIDPFIESSLKAIEIQRLTEEALRIARREGAKLMAHRLCKEGMLTREQLEYVLEELLPKQVD